MNPMNNFKKHDRLFASKHFFYQIHLLSDINRVIPAPLHLRRNHYYMFKPGSLLPLILDTKWQETHDELGSRLTCFKLLSVGKKKLFRLCLL